ncbi:unnamed protein product [Paramecium pentaurelia]|uniref:Transmembrane protein n=1 Tax=Paramecium pentaurelia TaxID=43138 RepID=A0A8S1VGV5_9CILI|nr:unnamed protein product [Paramecium pentaurelia]
MNDDSQIETYQFQINLNNFEIDSYFAYGLWSRYTPLGNIAQVGSIGILESNCFHLHNAVQQSTKELNLIVYDCLNYEKQTIVRRIQFITIDENWHQYEVQLDNQNYEYIWHYFEITQWPLRKRFELLIIQYPEIKLYQIEEDVLYPYKDTDLLLTFGGGLQIQSQNTIQILNGISTMSFFPGNFILYPLSIDIMSITRQAANIALSTFQFRSQCFCNQNWQTDLINQELTWLDNIIFPSQYPNCNSFQLKTWIKITNIHQTSQEFQYQIIKLSANFENTQLTDDNLSTFQLFYKFNQLKTQLIFTTYSYTFPIVSINFQNDPFLIRKEFDLINDIKLWHYVQVILKDNQLTISIIFYGEFTHFDYKTILTVNQFNLMKLKLQYGNILQSTNNYLTVKFVDSSFVNCVDNDVILELNCHFSCQECDGPTNQDCLSCSKESNRIYKPQQKSCVCPYNTIDDQQCKDFQSYNFIIVNENVNNQKCLQGYFQFEQKCIKCPSIISNIITTCLECIYQPESWASDPFCKTNIFNDVQGTVTQFLQTQQQYYIFDGNEIIPRQIQNSILINEDLINELELVSLQFRSLCFRSQSPQAIWRSEKECFNCALENCFICQITASKTVCLKCDYFSELKDGICVITGMIGGIEINKCLAPYYITSTYQCKLCNIENCQYCFEYLSNDLTKCTLYKYFEQFDFNEYHQIGCALCKDGFIFDFIQGICKYQKPYINNCIRSYINLQGYEICTLSKEDNFNIAPEIIGCNKYISYCKQCLQTPQKVIKCILCEDGYTTSLTTGSCYKCSIENSKICIEGHYQLKDDWVQLIQSFLMQFLPNQYLYPKPNSFRFIVELPFECSLGYKPDPYSNCIKYCDSDCLQCLLSQDLPYRYYCNECPLNYYKLPIISSEQGKCIQCPQLCQLCQSRTEQEIKNINPYFIVTDQTIIYTYKCLQKAPDNNIVIDPYTKVAKYCENSICIDNIKYQFEVNCDNNQFIFQKGFQYDYYEQQINLNYSNQLGINKLTIIFNFILISEESCNFIDETIIQNQFKQNIFSIQQAQIQIIGSDKQNKAFQSKLRISNYDTVQIINMLFYIMPESFMSFDNYDDPINLIITNTTIFGDINQISKYSINFTKSNDCILQNISFTNLNLNNSILFEHTLGNSNNQIQFWNIIIDNCIFQNSVLFQFINSKQNIKINYITISNCQFYNSTIFNFNSTVEDQIHIFFDDITIYNNLIILSTFVQNTQQLSVSFRNIIFSQNNVSYSKILVLTNNLQIQNTYIIYNKFTHSQYLFYNSQLRKAKDIYIYTLSVKSNDFTNSSLLNLLSIDFNDNLKVTISNILLKNNIRQLISEQLYLFSLTCQQILIQNCTIESSINLHHFKLFDTQSIKIENITYLNLQQVQQVPYSFECINSNDKSSQLLYVSGFQKLFIQKIWIYNQFSIDISLVHILSNILYQPNVKEIIEIKDALFQGNILLKQNLGSIFSQILIYSEKLQEIRLENIIFQEDFFNEQIDDPSQTSAGLLFINSQQSNVFINNITCQQNAITNSSNSFIYINSISVQIQYIRIKNHNYLNYTIWQKYYTIPLSNQNNQDEINLIISSIYTIQNKGGAMSITSSYINITQGQFTQIYSQSSSIFDIKTQGLGIVKFESLYISQAEVDLVSSTETQGCVSIYSKNSQLNLQIKNVQFQNVFNRLSSSILSIIPSQKYNKIDIHNVILENCLSLNNQFMKIEFSQQKQDHNLVIIENLSIYQSNQDWIDYFNKIDPISLSEMNKINIDNALINLNGCQLIIKELISEGIFISPILKIIESQKIQITNCKVHSIKTFYSFSILYFGQTKTIKSSIFLEGISIKNITIYQLNNEDIIQQKDFQIKFNFNKCTIQKSISTNEISSSHSFQSILQYLNQNISQKGSLIFIQSISNENLINLKSFSIMQNNQSGNLHGLIYFDLSGFQVLKIVEVNFIQNKIDQVGCLNFIANKNLENKIIIINSKFILNNGTYGSAIYAKQVIIQIKNCQFIKNIAGQHGGAIYMENCSNNFRITNSLILDNKAKEGGGIYFNGNNHINKNNIKDSLIKLNSAEKLTDNIVELPHHLTLTVNSYEMLSSQYITENMITNILKLNSYKIIEQGQLLETNYLYLPSNQQIDNFKLYNPNNEGFLSYIYELSMYFQNSLNEKVNNFINFTCNLQMLTLTQSNQSIKDPKPIQLLTYDLKTSTYDLSQFSFTFDPYKNIDELLLVQINCSTQQNTNNLRYIFKAKTFKCQLGEFYINDGCQLCQPNQGFYSVTYNATKCSIFDKAKFQNITSNKIQLLEGFWRPNILSDLTEQCLQCKNCCIGGWGVGNSLCVLGHIGGLCEECDNYNIQGNGHYFKILQNSSCSKCYYFFQGLVPFLMSSVWGVLQILLTLRSIDRSNQLFSSLKLKQKFGKILFKLNQDHESIMIKMLLNYLWIFSIIFTFNISFSFSFDFVDQACNTSFFMANSLDCYLIQIQDIQVNYSRIITQFILIFAQLLLICGSFKVHSIATKNKFNKSIVSNTALYLYLSNFAAIIKQFFSLLAKRKISNIDYIQGNVSLQFNTQSHERWIYFFILPGLGLIGCLIPFILFSLMFLMRKKLDLIKIRRHICYMFNEYNDESFFWEFVKIWKKTILISILTYFESNIFLKASLIGLCLLFYQLLALKIKPYIIKSLNLLDISTDQICSITIFLAAVKYVSEQEQNNVQSVLLQVLIAILCIKLCYPFLQDIFRVYYKKYKIIYLTYLIKIFKYIKPNSFFVVYLNQQLMNWKDKEVQLQKNYLKLKQYLFNVSRTYSQQQKQIQSILSPSQTQRNRLTSKDNEIKILLISDRD